VDFGISPSEFDGFSDKRNIAWDRPNDQLAPLRGFHDPSAARDGKGQPRSVLECDGLDPLKTDKVMGWLKASYSRQNKVLGACSGSRHGRVGVRRRSQPGTSTGQSSVGSTLWRPATSW